MVVMLPVKTINSRMGVSFRGKANTFIPFGAALAMYGVTAGAETLVPAKNEEYIVGFAQGPRGFVPRGGYDHFYYNEEVGVIVEEANAWVTPNGANINIDAFDFLEIAALGDGSTSPHGILEEAGSVAGKTKTLVSVAQALAAVSMGSTAYKVPASNVAVGDETITMTGGDIATMDLDIGDHIALEDLNGAVDHNVVADLTSTVITLVRPSLVALTAGNNDLVTKLFQVPVRML
jgi:hypothetical protein